MPQLRLRNALLSFVWFSAAAVVWRQYLIFCADTAELWAMGIHAWHPRIPMGMVFPLAVAGVLTLFGRWRSGLALGISSATFVAYRYWGMLEEQRAIRAIEEMASL